MALLTRRRFTLTAAATLAATQLPAQIPAQLPAQDPVAALEHDHILATAARARTAHPSSLLETAAAVAALTAHSLLTADSADIPRIQSLLDAWVAAPGPVLPTDPAQSTTIDSLIPLAELTRATTFLIDQLSLAPMQERLRTVLTWLTTSVPAQLARDSADHRASAWLLLTAALARALRAASATSQLSELDELLDQCRHRFRAPTLRHQISAAGTFPQELATPNPFRNTLFNFDLLTGACQLLSSPFDDLWHVELVDGIGLRSVAAALYPILASPTSWPGVADAAFFREVPLRRPGLLFAGRAFRQPDYLALYRRLPPPAPTLPAELAATLPIYQPLLFTARPPHGL